MSCILMPCVSFRGVERRLERVKVEKVTNMLLQLLDAIPEGRLTAAVDMSIANLSASRWH